MEDRTIQLPSVVLKKDIPVRLLIPSGKHLKCLVLLHGYNGTQDQWVDKTTIKQLAEEYGLVVVMPSCGNGYYEDTRENMPYFIGVELVSYVRATLPVSKAQEDWFIAGVSMGGFGALLIGARYHNVFGKITSFSGAFIIPDVVIGNQGVLGNADPEYFRNVFGDFETLEGSDRDPVAEAIRVSQSDELPKICLLCGSEDDLYQGNVKAAKDLLKHGISVLWYGGRGNHRWPFWNDMLPHVIRWLAQDFIPEGVDNGYISSNKRVLQGIR